MVHLSMKKNRTGIHLGGGDAALYVSIWTKQCETDAAPPVALLLLFSHELIIAII